jgi:hypothetical protein
LGDEEEVELAAKAAETVIGKAAKEGFQEADKVVEDAAAAGTKDALRDGSGVTISTGPNDFSMMHDASGSGIIAHLDENGVLSTAIYRNPGSTLSGKQMFDGAMAHFGDRVTAVEGNWFAGDNLGRVNELTGAGVPLEDAVTQTWTAGRAGAYGFTRVAGITSEGVPGAFRRLTVLFGRP